MKIYKNINEGALDLVKQHLLETATRCNELEEQFHNTLRLIKSKLRQIEEILIKEKYEELNYE